MEYLKKIGISLGYAIGIFLVSLFLVTLLHYFGLMGSKVASVFKIILLVLSLFIGGFINGKKSKENGWLEGIKLSLIVILFLALLALIFGSFSFSIKHILFYAIVLGSTTFGSMVGINKQIENK